MLRLFYKLLTPKPNKALRVYIMDVYCLLLPKGSRSSCQKTKEVNLSSHTLHALKNRQVRALNASSTFWYPSPITLVPPSPFFPQPHGLSDSDMEGVAILKVGQFAHLTSFPHHSALPLPEELFWLVSIWKAGFGFDGCGAEGGGGGGGRGGGEIRAASAQPEKGAFSERDSWL